MAVLCGTGQDKGERMTDLCSSCEKYVETCDSFGNDIMSEETAKKIILDDPQGNILKRMEAVATARSILGEDCTMEEIWHWAET